ncbi:hypothetical protein B0H19DRAFT_1255248 [Mycena capillaripes]|nr:hypothetical protein B0H19DRAFT_1255248 [Mycena capillaripes]
MSGSDLTDTYGSMLIGIFFAIFFQGMLTVQTHIYYESFPTDSPKLKSLVAIVWILDFVHLILICQAIYHYLITNWGTTQRFCSPPRFSICTLCLSLQVWIFSNQNWVLTVLLLLACMTSFVLELVITIQISSNKSVASFSSIRQEVVSLFSLGAGVDIVIAGLLVWYLQQGKTKFEKTNFVLTRIIQCTVATGLATSLFALGCVAAISMLKMGESALNNPLKYLLKPHSFVFIGMHFSLGRMYTNALLATLNSRRNLRGALGNVHTMSWVATQPTRPTRSDNSSTLLVGQTATMTDYGLNEIGDKRGGSVAGETGEA